MTASTASSSTLSPSRNPKGLQKPPPRSTIDRVNAQQAPPNSRPHRGLRNQPPPLAQSRQGPLRRPRSNPSLRRLVVEREREIDAFLPDEFWKIAAIFTPDKAKASKAHRKMDPTSSPIPATVNATAANAPNGFEENAAFAAELVEIAGQKIRRHEQSRRPQGRRGPRIRRHR